MCPLQVSLSSASASFIPSLLSEILSYFPNPSTKPPSFPCSHNWYFLASVDPSTASFHMPEPPHSSLTDCWPQFAYAKLPAHLCTTHSFIWPDPTYSTKHSSFISLQSIKVCGVSRDPGFTTIQHSGCLLYTSPSPRDVEESRMPSSA